MKTFDKGLFSRSIQRKMFSDGLTTREAAKVIGISPATVNRLVNKRYIPDVYTYFAVCKWLGRHMEYYFKNVKDEKTN